jgi:hypothetical protein
LHTDQYGAADVYSFGVTIYEIFTSRPAYEGGYQNARVWSIDQWSQWRAFAMDLATVLHYLLSEATDIIHVQSDLVKQIVAGRRPDISDLPPLLGQFMAECWHEDPRMRPTFPEIVQRLVRLKAVRFPSRLTGTISQTYSAPQPADSDDSDSLEYDINTNYEPPESSPFHPKAQKPPTQGQSTQGPPAKPKPKPYNNQPQGGDDEDTSLKDISGEAWGLRTGEGGFHIQIDNE